MSWMGHMYLAALPVTMCMPPSSVDRTRRFTKAALYPLMMGAFPALWPEAKNERCEVRGG